MTLLDLHSTPIWEHHYRPLQGEISDSLVELQHLSYLDLSSNGFGWRTVPTFIGSLSKLTYLNLSYNWFIGALPYRLGNLSSLQSLDLRSNWNTSSANLVWLSNLSSLEHLDLSVSDLSKASDWQQVVKHLPHLKHLRLSQCSLSNIIPPSLSLINSCKSLVVLDLSFNNLSSAVYPWLYNFSSSLVDLELSGNQLQGSIPTAFRNMISLTNLYLSSNQIDGSIPRSFGELCNLCTLDLCCNNLNGELREFIQSLYGCTENSLEILGLCHNQLHGSLADITRFSSLKGLDLSHNQLDGLIPESIGTLSDLEDLDVASNSLQGVMTEAHFFNLS